MSHQVMYIVRIGGRDFNASLDKDQAATDVQLTEWNREGVFWECQLPGSSIEVLADLSSNAATLLVLPVRYSPLVAPDPDPQTTEIVKEYETALKERFPSVPITRVDEILIDEWSSGRGENWLQDPEQVNQLLAWLRRQNSGYWIQVQ